MPDPHMCTAKGSGSSLSNAAEQSAGVCGPPRHTNGEYLAGDREDFCADRSGEQQLWAEQLNFY